MSFKSYYEVLGALHTMQLNNSQKQKMPKIYITNYNPEFSYDLAREYGEPIYMTQGFVPPADFAAIERKFTKFAAEATSDDFLLLSGANILVAIAVAAWLRTHPEVTVLQHSKKRDESGRIVPAYTVFTVSR